MSTNFVHLVGLLFGVFCFASLHQAQSMVIFTNTNTTLKEELMNSSKINVVNGDQYLSKRLESLAPLTEDDIAREPRMTVIENQVVRGGSYYRPERELLVEGDKARDRRETYIRFNEVNGNQHTSKKRESPLALAEPETIRDRRYTYIRFNEVNGNQHTSKKRESPLALADPETVRDPRFTIIHENDVHGDQIIRGKRETMESSKDEKTRDRRYTYIRFNEVNGNQITSKKRESPVAPTVPETIRDRRYTYIRFNEVNGNQITSKKRESPVALAEAETIRDPRMTIIESPVVMGVPAIPSPVVPNLPGARGDFRPQPSFALPQNPANPMNDPTRPVPMGMGAQPQLASAPLPSMADPNAPRLPLGGVPNIVKEMTVNGNQVLSKK